MCFEKGEFKVGANDIWLGNIHGCDFFMNGNQFEYWKNTQLILDVTLGRGSNFSIEITIGIRFIIPSRLYTMEEMERLTPTKTGEEVRKEEAKK